MNIQTRKLKLYFISLLLFLSAQGLTETTRVNSQLENWSPELQFRQQLETINKNYLNNAMTVKVTPSGFSKLKTKIPQILKNQNLNQNTQPNLTMNLGSFKMDQLKSLTQGKLKNFVILLKPMLENIFKVSLDQVSPVVQFENLFYSFDLSKLDLQIKNTKNENEIILSLNIEVSDIILRWDSANITPNAEGISHAVPTPSLGSFKLIKAETKMALKRPFTLKGDIHVSQNEDKKIQLGLNDLTMNLNKVDLNFDFKQIQWKQLTESNKEQIDALNELAQSFLKEDLPIVVSSIQTAISNGKLATLFNGQASEFAHQYTEVGTTIPEVFTKKDSDTNKDTIIAGFNLKAMKFINDSLFLGFNSFIESSSNNYPLLSNINDEKKTKSLKNFISTTDAKTDKSADLTLLVSTDLIRRYFQINFEHKVFSNLNFEDYHTTVDILDAPKVKVLSKDEYKKYNITPRTNSIYLISSSLINLDLTNSRLATLPLRSIQVAGTVLLSLNYISDNKFTLLLEQILDASLPKENFIIRTSFSTATLQFNRFLNNHAINLMSSLSLVKNQRGVFQMLPDSMLGIPTLIKTIAPSAESPEMLLIDMSFDKK